MVFPLDEPDKFYFQSYNVCTKSTQEFLSFFQTFTYLFTSTVASFFIVLMLLGLIDTFFSRTSWNMLLYSENHTHWIPYFYVYKFSTHMPLTRHDRTRLEKPVHLFGGFYSHASCEAWLCHWKNPSVLPMFLLTCLLRGMTECNRVFGTAWGFYSHASCEAWQCVPPVPYPLCAVSTHMPLARHDKCEVCGETYSEVSTHMPLARHDVKDLYLFYSS